MHGSIEVGRRWRRFRASETESPHGDFLWTARVGSIIVGHDRYAARAGDMDWRLFGLARVAHAQGSEVSRSSAGRVAGEAVWVPTALLPRYDVTWEADDDSHISAMLRIDEAIFELRLSLHPDGRVASAVVDRWGDPENAGRWGCHPFGFETIAHASFAGVTIPCRRCAGWFFGTERWAEGEFVRFRIISYELAAQPA